MNVQKLLVLLSAIVCTLTLHAQKTFNARLIDISMNEPVPFATVGIKHSKTYTLSQMDGTVSLRVPNATDTVIITTMGYKEVLIPYAKISADTIDILLTPSANMLQNLVVLPGKNPAIPIVKRAIENRKINKPQAIKEIEFMEYNKLNFAISDLDSSVFNKPYFRKNPGILVRMNDYDDFWTLPLFFSERLSYQKNRENLPPITQDIIVNQVGSSFINSDIVNKYISSLNADMTFYGNLQFLYHDFVSPIMPQALLYYKYFLEDSLTFDGKMFYNIRFKPRNARDLAFYGHMIIERESGALLEINATLQESANLNYVKSLQLQERMQQLPSGEWFFKQHSMQVKFTPNVGSDTVSNVLNTPISAIKTTSFIVDSLQIQNYLLRREIPKKFNIIKHQNTTDTSLLAELRPDTLTSLDMHAKQAIEIANEIPSIKTTNILLDMFLYGYLKLGYVELGPYLYFIQSNEIEGTRINLAGRTSAKLSEDIMLTGYVGYGTRNRKFQYGGSFAMRLPVDTYSAFRVSFDQNIYRIGDYRQNLDFIRENVLVQSDDNLLNTLLTHEANRAVYFVQKTKAEVEYQVFKNLIVKPMYGFSLHHSPPFYPFHTNFDTTTTIGRFNVNEVACDFRVSFNEQVSTTHFRRLFVDSRYPVFHFNAIAGRYNFGEVHSWYSQLRFVARQHFFVGIGRFRYVLESGITTNRVPFPLLEVHRGNQTGGSGEYYFNLMRYMEFMSDRFVNLYAEYSLNGFFLNKLWLIRRLNLRELLTFKSCWGDLALNHNAVFELPTQTRTLSAMPYMEAGVGITNLLKVLRVEYIWRLSYRNNPDISTRGFFFRFQIEF
ncbi:MAG: DUF5686 and carboxypeptidase regulatory-like domain-containing protein [Bacteroidales bacterium]|jgi:hypothetical protein|nr:DUF5686 and carboxypeptidase regulatory-like domain-containing protein [Bacteroidales bacterium]